MKYLDGPKQLPDEDVRSFGDLIEAIERHSRGFCIFRGQKDCTWPLEPNIFRHTFKKKHLAQGIPQMLLESFKKSAIRYVQPPPNDWEWLAVAQHHGLLTPLLDWTGNPLVGAFFAVADYLNETECLSKSRGISSALWCYWPKQDHLGWCEDHHDPGISPFEIDRVVLFEPSHHSLRIPAQSAIFTVHPFLRGGISKPKWNGDLLRIRIPPGARVRIRRTLFRYGIHHASLFPDLDGTARHINTLLSFSEDEELSRKGAI